MRNPSGNSKEHDMSAASMDFGYTMPKSHLRLTQRGRTVLTTLAALPLVIAAFLFALNGGAASASLETSVQPGVEYTYVTIAAGESLWAIAEDIAPTADPRDVVNDVLAFNGMSSAELFPGQRLALPAKYADAE
jgi:hypothetical protein